MGRADGTCAGGWRTPWVKTHGYKIDRADGPFALEY